MAFGSPATVGLGMAGKSPGPAWVLRNGGSSADRPGTGAGRSGCRAATGRALVAPAGAAGTCAGRAAAGGSAPAADLMLIPIARIARVLTVDMGLRPARYTVVPRATEAPGRDPP